MASPVLNSGGFAIPDEGHIVRDISYADAAPPGPGRALIRAMENATGRRGLIRRAQGYSEELRSGGDVWSVMMARYGLRLDVTHGALTDIPRTGPLVVVANHPFGILDGLAMGYLLSRIRGDFRILANDIFLRAPEIAQSILPVSFEETPAALATNLATRRMALAHLARGGAIGVFPGGTVSTAARPFGVPVDPVWRGFTARMIARSDAQVVPVFFEGHTSRLFQIASHLHATLRMGLLIREFGSRTDRPVSLCIGKPIAPDRLAAHAGDAKELMDFLRKSTYELGPDRFARAGKGFEFEGRYREEQADGGRHIRFRFGRAHGS